MLKTPHPPALNYSQYSIVYHKGNFTISGGGFNIGGKRFIHASIIYIYIYKGLYRADFHNNGEANGKEHSAYNGHLVEGSRYQGKGSNNSCRSRGNFLPCPEP